MADYGARYTDKKIRETDRKIRETYKTAQRELKKKLSDFNARFAQQDQKKRQQVKNGELSKQEYKDWLTGQVFMRNQWKSSLREVSQVLMHSNQQALNVINNGRLDVFAENYNFAAFKGEGSTGISFGIYNTQAVARLLEEEPQILPEWKIDEEKDYEWNYKKVNNIVQQGIIQGDGVKEITDRLCTDLCTQNENKMMMFARTAYTGAQNAGRQEQMNDAADMGLEVHKQWLATLDNRTRDTHRMLDGEEVNYNENFSNDLEYPGDPEGDPAEVYNCRCTMVTIYPKYEDRSKPDWREEETIDGQSYDEWKEGKKESGSYATPKSVREGYTGLTKYDFDKKQVVSVPKDVQEIVDNAGKMITGDFPAVDDYLRLIGFGDFADDPNNPAAFLFAQNGNTPGLMISLNPDKWKSVAELKQYVIEEGRSGRHIKTDKPESIMAHEYGHAMIHILALKKIGYSGYGELTKGQQKAYISSCFEVMTGLSRVIDQNGRPWLSKTASVNDGEYVSEAIADYYYGERKPVSVAIIEALRKGL